MYGWIKQILFGDIENFSPKKISTPLLGGEEKGGLPMEAFAKVQELFSQVDGNGEAAALWILQQISSVNGFERLDKLLPGDVTDRMTARSKQTFPPTILDSADGDQDPKGVIAPYSNSQTAYPKGTIHRGPLEVASPLSSPHRLPFVIGGLNSSDGNTVQSYSDYDGGVISTISLPPGTVPSMATVTARSMNDLLLANKVAHDQGECEWIAYINCSNCMSCCPCYGKSCNYTRTMTNA